MLQKKDVTFYDRFTYVKEPSKIKITNENFYGGFALENPETYDSFIDERIYYPKAYFKRAEKKGKKFNWDIVELEQEPCRLEKFGSIYKEHYKIKDLNNLYCIKNMDFFWKVIFHMIFILFYISNFIHVLIHQENKIVNQ